MRPFPLEGLYLSDDPADPLLSALPADTLGPGQYYLIYAAGEGDSAPADCPYVSFGLTEEETILLTWVNETEDGVVSAHTIDSVYVPSGITSGCRLRCLGGRRRGVRGGPPLARSFQQHGSPHRGRAGIPDAGRLL